MPVAASTARAVFSCVMGLRQQHLLRLRHRIEFRLKLPGNVLSLFASNQGAGVVLLPLVPGVQAIGQLREA